MNTVPSNKYLWLIIGYLMIAGLVCEAQSRKPLVNGQYIYRIVVYQNNAQPKVLTGFKPEGYAGIVSALHGFTSSHRTRIVAQTFDTTGKVSWETEKITIAAVSIGEDLVLLKCADLQNKGGLSIAQNYILTDYEELFVYGYPNTSQLESSPHKTQIPSPTRLGVMLKGTKMAQILGNRKSPKLNTKVIRLPENAIYPGHSGGPVLNWAGKVVGIANGGFILDNQLKIGSMAVVFGYPLPGETYEPKQAFLAQMAAIEKYPAEYLSSATDVKAPGPLIDDIDFKKAKPFLTFGSTLSRPFRFTSGGQQTEIDIKNRNDRFDGYAELSTGSSWAIGAYVSSGYLQYTILKSFDLAIPLEAEQRVRQTRSPDTYGVQASYIFSRGVIHNAYLGAGYFPVVGSDANARLRFNYRGFVGYRLYAGPRRKVGLELRAMYVGQNVEATTWQPTLGNARPVPEIQSLTQWYVCAGLTYSIYRRK